MNMSPQDLITQKSVVLVSGGGRGITAHCVTKLAQEYPANYILLGRSAITQSLPDWVKHDLEDADLKRSIMNSLADQGQKPTPQDVNKRFSAIRAQQEIEGTLEKIRATDSQVDYLSVDITDIALLRPLMNDVINKYGPVTGIIHGAGALADRRIEKKTSQDYEKVLSPKLNGLTNLLAIAPVDTLDFLVLFSSIVGVFGNIGQTDYAMANEILNKAAHQLQRENPKCRFLVINWGPWDAGMVTPALKQAFAKRNMTLIPIGSGVDYFQKLLMSKNSQPDAPTQVIVGALPNYPSQPVSSELTNHLVKRELTLEANPFLKDHTIGAHAVLPATCAASWIASTCEQLYPGYAFFQMDAFKVLKGIVFNETLADEHFLEINEVEKSPERGINLSTRIFSHHKNGKSLYHYTAKIGLLHSLPPSPVHTLSQDLSNLHAALVNGPDIYDNGTLFHGPSFQGVWQVLDVSADRVVTTCRLAALPQQIQGQFQAHLVNPFMADAIVQSLLIWTQQVLQIPCLPSALERLQQYQPVLFDRPYQVEMRIMSQTDTTVLADIWVVDQNSRLVQKFTNLQGTISPLLKRFIGLHTTHNQSIQDD